MCVLLYRETYTKLTDKNQNNRMICFQVRVVANLKKSSFGKNQLN